MFERVAAVDDGRPYEIGAEAFADVLQDGSLQDLERLCEKALVPSAGANRGQLIQRLQARRCHCVGGGTLCIFCLPSRLSARVDGRPAASAFHDAIIAIIGDASACWLPRPPQVWHSHAAQRMTDWRKSRDRDAYEARSRRLKLLARAGAISGAADVREPHGAAAILAAEVRLFSLRPRASNSRHQVEGWWAPRADITHGIFHTHTPAGARARERGPGCAAAVRRRGPLVQAGRRGRGAPRQAPRVAPRDRRARLPRREL